MNKQGKIYDMSTGKIWPAEEFYVFAGGLVNVKVNGQTVEARTLMPFEQVGGRVGCDWETLLNQKIAEVIPASRKIHLYQVAALYGGFVWLSGGYGDLPTTEHSSVIWGRQKPSLERMREHYRGLTADSLEVYLKPFQDKKGDA